AAGLVTPPDPDLQADMYGRACDLLGAAGYEHYEVSNWALPGHRCLHNLGYWEDRPYLGLGAGAHSYRAGRRWWNVRPPQQYMASLAAGTKPVGGGEEVSDEEARVERLLLGLRVADGVPAAWVEESRAAGLVAEGLAHRLNGRIALTERGLFLANDLVLALAE
ncbi:MAG: radical SAM family heme chaperone HemW, partial [Actinomycetota bacterium]